jgi:RNA polymerase sigma factor (sigma-70 family)
MQFLGANGAESDAAFRTLVARHGPKVLEVCRRVLVRDEDAEDAFQVTFLALAQSGASIRDQSAVAAWLHEAAYRIALKARARVIRRRAAEKMGAMPLARIEPGDQGQELVWKELRPILHEELVRLPEECRLPTILGYLGGKTNEEVAALLGWPVGTVKGRLARARELLRSRLARRGLALSVALLVTALA